MRIAVFDHSIVPTNPSGGCHLRLIAGLCRQHEFTVFSIEFDNPAPERVDWVHVRVPTRPLALQFISFHLLAPLHYLIYRIRHRTRFDLVQMVESDLSFGDLSYTHFCHRAYRRRSDSEKPLTGLRPFFLWLDHTLHALLEPRIFRHVKNIVVPSRGLAEELQAEYPSIAGKVTVIANPVDIDHMKPAPGFDRAQQRAMLGLGQDDVAVIFVALGHFERKGLPLLLEAMSDITDDRLKLVVVGGRPDVLESYQKRLQDLRLQDRVHFVGMRDHVRNYLWAADLFALPSSYEAFSLATAEAAAAELPLLVTKLHGVEEFVRDGRSGYIVDRTVDGIKQGLQRFLDVAPPHRRSMGLEARKDVERYGVGAFVEAWAGVYREIETGHQSFVTTRSTPSETAD